MEEKKYEILDGFNKIASDMSLDIALCLIKGYANDYYNEHLKLTIAEMPAATKTDK